LLFVWSAHVVLDVQRSFQLPNWRFFPQPLKPTSKNVWFGRAEARPSTPPDNPRIKDEEVRAHHVIVIDNTDQ
jgi:hypothetical protein